MSTGEEIDLLKEKMGEFLTFAKEQAQIKIKKEIKRLEVIVNLVDTKDGDKEAMALAKKLIYLNKDLIKLNATVFKLVSKNNEIQQNINKLSDKLSERIKKRK